MGDAAKVRMIVLDVDGVLTDGSINLDEDGREFKRFHVRDGYAIKAWMRMGFEAGIISGRGGGSLRARAKEMGIERVVECCPEKGGGAGEDGGRGGRRVERSGVHG